MLGGCANDKHQTSRFLALGDSYTIGEGVSEVDRWPEHVLKSLEARGEEWNSVEYVATTGWTSGDLLKSVAERNLAPTYSLVGLCIGANDVFQNRTIEEFSADFDRLVQKAIELGGGEPDRVFVVSIPDYGASHYAVREGITTDTKKIEEFNRVVKRACEVRGVLFIDIMPVSRRNGPAWYASDDLHPSRRQYEAWGETIWEAIRKMRSVGDVSAGEQK